MSKYVASLKSETPEGIIDRISSHIKDSLNSYFSDDITKEQMENLAKSIGDHVTRVSIKDIQVDVCKGSFDDTMQVTMHLPYSMVEKINQAKIDHTQHRIEAKIEYCKLNGHDMEIVDSDQHGAYFKCTRCDHKEYW